MYYCYVMMTYRSSSNLSNFSGAVLKVIEIKIDCMTPWCSRDVLLFKTWLYTFSGYYCPAGTKYSTEYPCPLGTFSNVTGLQNVSVCTACPGGYFCDQLALTEYSKTCQAG